MHPEEESWEFRQSEPNLPGVIIAWDGKGGSPRSGNGRTVAIGVSAADASFILMCIENYQQEYVW